eukprot:1146296-Pelagomonas_calceolata.AAC.3
MPIWGGGICPPGASPTFPEAPLLLSIILRLINVRRFGGTPRKRGSPENEGPPKKGNPCSSVEFVNFQRRFSFFLRYHRAPQGGAGLWMSEQHIFVQMDDGFLLRAGASLLVPNSPVLSACSDPSEIYVSAEPALLAAHDLQD